MLDYIVLENMVSNTHASMRILLDEFKREGRRGITGLFNVFVSFNTQGLLFSPDEKEINDSIIDILKEIIRVVKDTNRVLEHADFEQYLKASV